MQKIKTRDFWFSLIICLLGVLGLAIMVKHIAEWATIDDFWLPEPRDPYTLTEVASRWTHAVYFTNITLFAFCIWAILNFLSLLFDWKKLEGFLRNKYVLLFIVVNQLLVLLTFTGLTCLVGFELRPEDASPGNIHNVATSIFKHYFLTTISIVYCLSFAKKERVDFKKCLMFLVYPVVYTIVAKIVGKCAFAFEWYPYPFFAAKHLWKSLFGSLEHYNPMHAKLMVAGIVVAIAALYVLLIYLCCLVYNALARAAAKRREKTKQEIIN